MDSTISSIHASCVLAFLAVIDALQSPIHQKHLKDAFDVFDRYRLWAGNVGAMHKGAKYEMSLDYRLREAFFYRDQVSKLLQDLRSSLDKALHLIADKDSAALGDTGEDCATSDASLDESDSIDSPWEVSSDSETEQSPETPQIPNRPHPEAPPLQLGIAATKTMPLDSAKFVVDCLWKLPIRRPAPVDRMRKKATADTSGYVPFDIMYVRDKYPNLHETVALRLAKMISRRRQLIKYCKDHTKVLQHEEKLSSDTFQLMYRRQSRADGNDGFSETTSSLKTQSQTTAITKATTLKPGVLVSAMKPGVGLYTPSISNSGSSTASEQAGKDIAIRIPNRPMGDDGKALDHFICPYCSTAQVITSGRQWKKHVLLDLQPYICTYPECQLNEYLFETVDDWFNHESRTHRVEWFCNTESHESFSEMSGFLEHMHKIHSEPLSEAQLLSLHHGFQRPSHAASGTCTLCGKHAHMLKSHLSRHLRQISLFAIPQTDYMAHCEEDDTLSNAARQSVPDSPGLHSTAEHSDLSSEASSLNFSDGDGDIEDGPSSEDIETLETAEYGDEHVDTSWDQITPKFREARIAMQDDQISDFYERLSSPPSIRHETGMAGRYSLEHYRKRVTSHGSRESVTEFRPKRVLNEPWTDHEPWERGSNLIPNKHTAPRSSISDTHVTESNEPPNPSPSLRQRACRITSNILSPFRSRPKNTPSTDETGDPARYPEVPGKVLRNTNLKRISRQYSRLREDQQDQARGYSSTINDGNQDEDVDQILGPPQTPAPTGRISPDPLSAAPRQPPGKNPSNDTKEGANIGEQRNWRQRLSKAVRGRSKPPVTTKPAEQETPPHWPQENIQSAPPPPSMDTEDVTKLKDLTSPFLPQESPIYELE